MTLKVSVECNRSLVSNNHLTDRCHFSVRTTPTTTLLTPRPPRQFEFSGNCTRSPPNYIYAGFVPYGVCNNHIQWTSCSGASVVSLVVDFTASCHQA